MTRKYQPKRVTAKGLRALVGGYFFFSSPETRTDK